MRYEAEAAYISDYQEIKNNQAVGTGIYEYDDNCSGGLKATWLGGSEENDLVFRDVYVGKGGNGFTTQKAECQILIISKYGSYLFRLCNILSG